jgi:hypothetical protein
MSDINMMDPLGLDSELTVNNSMSSFKKEYPPKGNNQAVICFVIPAGTHTEQFPNKPPQTKKKVLCIYETKARKEDGKRFVKRKEWTFSMDERANMRIDINSMGFDTNSDFNLKSLVGHNFIVNFTHEKDAKGNIKVKTGAFTSLMDGITPIEPETTELPDWAKAYIAESVEYRQKYGEGAKGPYADAIQKALEKKAKYGDNKAPAAAGSTTAAQEDDLPF